MSKATVQAAVQAKDTKAQAWDSDPVDPVGAVQPPPECCWAPVRSVHDPNAPPRPVVAANAPVRRQLFIGAPAAPVAAAAVGAAAVAAAFPAAH